ncbi:MAG: HAD hydrolase-like protein [Phycisphaerales bacterium]|nr:haloacid dehalogenase-like hydrolase [Phycisphaerae bacterium]NNF43465.1 HAD hydrolase-like protein [Phycisphaerales bacterium]NNM24421.1 HAD hydrolase-like protein [Phycisphaerales bacterium]
MLILFDIDGTLLLTDGAGLRAMADAGHAMRGAPFALDGVTYAGRLDTLIWDDVARLNGIDDPAERHAEFRAAYAAALAPRLTEERRTRSLPGVPALLDALDEIEGVTLGLLTGNYPETGRLKLEAAELDPDRFAIASWGSDGRSRRALPPVALERFEARFGHAMPAERTLIIGDTPHDIDCARASGCRVLAVATGPSATRADLHAHTPDLLLDDLSDTGVIVEWIRSGCPAPSEQPGG